MSDQPPPYGGHVNYAQQWPPAYPSTIPSNFPVNSEYTQPYPTPFTGFGQPLDHNMASVNANSRISGSSGPSNSAPLFPPQFPGYNQFDPLRFPPPFPQMPFAPVHYPPAPVPAASLNGSMEHLHIGGSGSGQPSTVGVRTHTTSVPSENHREEGEVSEDRDERSILPTRKAGRQHSDLEEGETISSSAPSASSGSPYNPPLSVSADLNMIHQATKDQKNESSKTAQDPHPQKSVAQLRIQAQGALLSLAPHKIRYNELVAEGINPVILRRLYEEVGIKVTPPPDQGPSVLEAPPAVTSITGKPLEVKKSAVADIANDEKEGARKPELPVSQPSAPSAAAPSKPDKPLERKELIARMLAEKAAKTSKDTSPTGSANPPSTAPVNEPRPTQRAAANKEKNKAQTELARQRIEELKRQSLLKAQQSAQRTPAPTQLETPSPAIQHPLPLRPPVPGSQPVATLPGLVMTGSGQGGKESSVSEPAPAIAAGSASASQPSQRKRPRASDFDEPVAASRNNFQPTANRFNPAEKLIIAISDDESLYGDDEDDNMDLDSSSEQDAAPIVTSTTVKPPAQTHSIQSPVVRPSTSTPNAPSSVSDPGDIRIKDMEIQAMRRKIAELELRRKSKLAASRTQSPRTVDDSGSSSSGGPSSAAAPTSEDSMNTKPITAPISVAPALQPQTPSEILVDQVPCEEANDQAANGAVDDTAQATASIVSDSDGSAMDESDDSSSGSSQSSNESEVEPAGSPAHVETGPAISPTSSAAMEIDTPGQSPSRELPSASGDHGLGPAEEYVAVHSPSVQSHREMSAESDGYEPPEPESDDKVQSEDSSYSPPPFSPALPGLVENAADSTQPEVRADEELTNAPQVLETLPHQPQSASQVGAPGAKATSAISKPAFTPYISPLRTFKAYRYHPRFAEEVPNGYRSLTYSHNIDSMKYLCPYDLNGGVCNDKTCEFQHLRDITLSDDKILVQMGSVREGQTEEEKETYLAGLKDIINDLRRDKVKDFNTVASEIAAYRRRFLQDPSRILSL